MTSQVNLLGEDYLKNRTNKEWLRELRLPSYQRNPAIANLREVLLRGLRSALSSWPRVDRDTLEDLVQDALLKIMGNIDSFRGECRFTTWALKIAVRTALSELRRRHWRNISLEAPGNPALPIISETLVEKTAGPEQQAIQRLLLKTLNRIISSELTERQRSALIAVRVQGMPIDEVARRMGTNRNSLYKLMYDARKHLKKAILAEGLTPREILDAFDDRKS